MPSTRLRTSTSARPSCTRGIRSAASAPTRWTSSSGNTASIYGPEDEIPFPDGASSIDAGLGLAAVIGAEGAVGGYTLANSWRAADLAGAKSRDFALSIGPVIVTDLEGRSGLSASLEGTDEAARFELEPDWAQLVAHAARNTVLRPGALLIVDAGGGDFELRSGAVVALAAEGIGVLRNRVG